MPKRWKINPDESAMWNLFDACRVAALYLRRQAIKKVNLSHDEWDEFYDEVLLKAVTHFLEYKIKRKTYCHEVSFFNNCFSSVWGAFQTTLDSYLNNVVKRKLNSIDHMELTRESRDWLLNTPLPRYKGEHGDNITSNAQRNLRLWKNRSMSPTYLNAEDENDFMSYLECCEEYGITPNEKAPLYRRGRHILKL